MHQVDAPPGRRSPVFTADGCPPTPEEGAGSAGVRTIRRPPCRAASPDPGRAVRDGTEPVSLAIPRHPASGIDPVGGRSGGVSCTRSHTVCSLGVGDRPLCFLLARKSPNQTGAPDRSDPGAALRWTSAGDSHRGGRRNRPGHGQRRRARRSDRPDAPLRTLAARSRLLNGCDSRTQTQDSRSLQITSGQGFALIEFQIFNIRSNFFKNSAPGRAGSISRAGAP
jgi:hypothetical protein